MEVALIQRFNMKYLLKTVTSILALCFILASMPLQAGCKQDCATLYPKKGKDYNKCVNQCNWVGATEKNKKK